LPLPLFASNNSCLWINAVTGKLADRESSTDIANRFLEFLAASLLFAAREKTEKSSAYAMNN
jgi:hypothetical protein